ncbi:threonine synthase [Oleiagrimonas soli]|uniref:Threonine synthase n=1 Tax=Oleiagrimonas soli TaxID=1543381 RepID=A0A099CS82_9GAMM|nr:threonine synthase [Oleiagrimonas soli]KGI76619.1 threonine synthase [Oleiagrimonas soli]MBB6184943.1 threonine synthase [Oleiagrimonas soli]
MRFLSTRGDAPAVGLSAAIAAGLAPDGGLYVPAAFPRADLDAIAPDATLPEIAAWLLRPWFAGDPLAAHLDAICREALAFDTPLRPLPWDDTYLLELFHGPTAAFKDVGARFLAACMRRLRAPSDPPLTILVATSGDTGAAVGAAFHRLPGFRVVILYPDGRVSPRQAHQLGCFGDNVHAFRVAGSFDDCQRMVKTALGDTDLQARTPLSSANSISLGRLLPQMSYYAQAALRLHAEHGVAPDFVVPTGNLGNALACVWARTMGLPIGKVHLACNANAVLPDFLAGADYAPRASVATLANAMDVGAPSNAERLRWMFDDDFIRAQFTAQSVDDVAIRDTVRALAAEHDLVVCPHTATALHVLARLRDADPSRLRVAVATAHPAKFEGVIEPLIGRSVPVPSTLDHLLRRVAHAEPLPADDDALREVLLDSVR